MKSTSYALTTLLLVGAVYTAPTANVERSCMADTCKIVDRKVPVNVPGLGPKHKSEQYMPIFLDEKEAHPLVDRPPQPTVDTIELPESDTAPIAAPSMPPMVISVPVVQINNPVEDIQAAVTMTQGAAQAQASHVALVNGQPAFTLWGGAEKFALPNLGKPPVAQTVTVTKTVAHPVETHHHGHVHKGQFKPHGPVFFKGHATGHGA